MKVLNFGSLNVDYVYSVDHMIMPGETQNSSGMNIFLGGKGFNQSVALAKAGVEVYHAGQIGEDGLMFLDGCKEYGVNTKYIRQMEGKGGHTIIQVDKNGQNSIILYGGSNRTISREFVDSVLADFEEGDYLVLQNEINQLDYIIDQAYAKGMKIVLNPSPFDSELDACDMNKVSYFLLNEIEGAQLTGETELSVIPDRILEMYPNSAVMLTMGHAGSVYKDAKETVKQGIYKVKAVDTTAAGDTFTGYFIAGLIAGEPMAKILDTAAKASAIAVSRAGASPSIPSKKEVEEAKL